MEFAALRNSVRFFTRRSAVERANLACLRTTVENVAPDCILVWGMWNLPRSLPAAAERWLPGRVVYYMGDYWPALPSQYQAYWESPARSRAAAVIKAPLRWIALRMLARERLPEPQLDRVMFPTRFLQEEFARRGILARQSAVVYGAIDTSQYAAPALEARRRDREGCRLLWVGRLTPEKGVRTAIETVAAIVNQHGLRNVTLTVAGPAESTYQAELARLARERGVERNVVFVGAQPTRALPALYRDADVLLFTSIWPEPFGRVIVEAMASGVAVVAARSGGATEILSDGHNALLCRPDDPEQMASQVVRLITSPALHVRLAGQGRRDALVKYDVGRMVKEIEEFLRQAVANAGASEPGQVRLAMPSC
jgi:glycosyltransferase involved in cell wall biosynthesis